MFRGSIAALEAIRLLPPSVPDRALHASEERSFPTEELGEICRGVDQDVISCRCWELINGMDGIYRMLETADTVVSILGNLSEKGLLMVGQGNVDYVSERAALLRKSLPFVMAEDELAGRMFPDVPRLHALRVVKLYTEIAGTVWTMAEYTNHPILSGISSTM